MAGKRVRDADEIVPAPARKRGRPSRGADEEEALTPEQTPEQTPEEALGEGEEEADEEADEEAKDEDELLPLAEDDDESEGDGEMEERFSDDDDGEYEEVTEVDALHCLKRGHAHSGVMELVRVDRFMCHECFEYKLGPNVNIINGPNGACACLLVFSFSLARVCLFVVFN